MSYEDGKRNTFKILDIYKLAVIKKTMKEFIEIAKLFIEKKNQDRESPHPDYRFGFCKEPENFIESWYFDFLMLPNKEIPKDEIMLFAGAPGFIISKTSKTVKVISHGEIYELKVQLEFKQKLNQLLYQFEKKEWNSSSIRKLTGLRPKEILEMKKKYERLDFSVEENKLVIMSEITKRRRENDR